MSIVKQAAQGNQKVSEELFKQLDSTIKFQSPFEQMYIILKLQRKERPLVEPIFHQLKNVWDIHI
jgi:beta-lactamase class D